MKYNTVSNSKMSKKGRQIQAEFVDFLNKTDGFNYSPAVEACVDRCDADGLRELLSIQRITTLKLRVLHTA